LNKSELCELFGKSKQAYYQRLKFGYSEEDKTEILLQMIERERKIMPRLGGRKLLHRIQHKLPEELYLGRDALFDFLREHGLLIRKRRYRVKTTYSNHWLRKYPNLIKGFIPGKAHQLWVSDITYIETAEGNGYLNLITDAYSRKIIGWELGPTLQAKHTIKALQMAIKQLPKGTKDVLHHSDRGVQYCCDDYVKLLNKNKFQISMTESGDPRDNAIAERVNGILKDEWLNQMRFKTREEAWKELKGIILIYNHDRPHLSLDMNTPEYAHCQSSTLNKRWRNYYDKSSKDQEKEKISTFV
jgi:transposase InsO family protein